MALIKASLEELPVRADLGQTCLATKISAPGPSILGGSATRLVAGRRGRWGPLKGGERSSQTTLKSIKLDRPTR